MSNKIHPTCIIEGAVEIGEGNEIGPYSVIYGPT
jgi:UDP-N-acetylglucosamine acyltransferase